MEKPEKAEELFNLALELLEKLEEQNPENRIVMTYKAGTLNNLGVLLSEMGKTEDAKEIYGQALKLQEEIYGLEHPQVAQTLNNLALLYFQTTSYEKALILYTRSLEIMEKLGKTEHTGFATTLNNLAGVHVQKGRNEKALDFYTRALEIRERILGPDHPEVAKTLNNLGELSESLASTKRLFPFTPVPSRYTKQLSVRHTPMWAPPSTTLLVFMKAWENTKLQ